MYMWVHVANLTKQYQIEVTAFISNICVSFLSFGCIGEGHKVILNWAELWVNIKT